MNTKGRRLYEFMCGNGQAHTCGHAKVLVLHKLPRDN